MNRHLFFHVEPLNGILAPNYSKKIRVTFTPQNPIVYHRRVLVLIHQHVPLAIDLYGNAYDTFNHPPKLKVSHIDQNRVNYSKGLQKKPPHILTKDFNIELPTEDFINSNLIRNPCTISKGIHLFEEFFRESRDLIIASSKHFEFGQCQRDVSPQPQVLSIKNNTDGLITLFWQKPPDGILSIEPESIEIAKQKSVDFNLTFHPLLEFQFMGSTLEGYAQFKEMRNANIIEFPTLPFVLTPFADGHTMDDVTSFIPSMRTSHQVLYFGATTVGDMTYQTFYIENRGDCAFKLFSRVVEADNPDKGTVNSSSASFQIYPSICTIAKDSFQIFVVKFSPTQVGHFHAQVFALINDSPTNYLFISLKGESSLPSVSFSITGTLFLHPVSLGSISSHSLTLKNESSIPVLIEWKIPSQFSDSLIVSPSSAEIRSKEVISCLWEFNPRGVGEIHIDVVCNVQVLKNASPAVISQKFLPFILGPQTLQTDQNLMNVFKVVQHYPLTISTIVTDCEISSKPQKIEFGFVRIHSSSTSTISISNHSDSEMQFTLQSSSNRKLLQFSPAEDILPPRSTREIEVRFTPKFSGELQESILCSLIGQSEFRLNNQSASSRNEICQITGIGCYPQLSVIDIFSPKTSREIVWFKSSVNDINNELSILGINSLTDDLKTFPVDFGYDVLDGPPSVISFKFQNTGHIAFNFSINFPNDISIDPEYWALPDEIDPNQLKQDQIIQTRLFRVNEKKYHLEPGATATVSFSYTHKYIETHELPVVLSVQNGRIIRLILKGNTIEPFVPYIINPSSVIQLNPVPIGALEPPVQYLQIFNASLVDAEYNIEIAQLEEVNEHNFNFEIFHCLTQNWYFKFTFFWFIAIYFQPS